MYFTTTLCSALVAVLLATPEVAAHGTITAVSGANGVQAAGFGILADTPRDGSRANPFQVCPYQHRGFTVS